MEVTLETVAGRRFTVEIWFFSTVRRIKEYVLRQEGIPVESQRLFFAGAELDDDGDTERYSILQGSTVLLLLPEDGAAPPSSGGGGGGGGGTKAMVRVVVNAPAALAGKGGAVTVEVDAAACTVAGLKERVQEGTDGALPAARVALMFGKVEMEDGRAVAEYGAAGRGGGRDGDGGGVRGRASSAAADAYAAAAAAAAGDGEREVGSEGGGGGGERHAGGEGPARGARRRGGAPAAAQGRRLLLHLQAERDGGGPHAAVARRQERRHHRDLQRQGHRRRLITNPINPMDFHPCKIPFSCKQIR
uniref:Ubiquitin family protein, expressed n=1 Tax=Oryza sativa subsp. japonica TaxID=39947 RepID=Q2QU13_ORYSJ|nr:Ubiquitin family protein, expressed [Oryza sativa Japonica Group]